MTTVEYLSSRPRVESSMEDASQTPMKPRNLKKTNKKRGHYRRNGDEANGGEDDDDEGREEESKDEECDKDVWDTLTKTFRQVQSVLDRNRVLIQQVNENHQSKMPDNLVKNVAIIREINGNISKVMSVYSDLSVKFSNIVHQRRAIIASDYNDDNNEKSDINGDKEEESAGLLNSPVNRFQMMTAGLPIIACCPQT